MARRTRSSGWAQIVAVLLLVGIVAVVAAAGVAVLVGLGLVGLLPPTRTWARERWLSLGRSRRTPSWARPPALWAGQHLGVTGAAAIAVVAAVALSSAVQHPAAAPVAAPGAAGPSTTASSRGESQALGPMPDVVGQHLDAAKATLGDRTGNSVDFSELARGQVEDTNWTVVQQTPPAGSQTGEAVAQLAVLRNEEFSWLTAHHDRMPDVTGQDYSALTAPSGMLSAVSELVEPDPTGDPFGVVVSQRPAAGAPVDLSHKIVLRLREPAPSPEPTSDGTGDLPNPDLPNPNVPNPNFPGHAPHLPGGHGHFHL